MSPRRWLILALLSLTVGCVSRPSLKPTLPSRPIGIGREDACASRLHDLSQALLLFYLRNGQLPDTLEQLRQASDPTLLWECPVTHEPYVYDRVGFYDMQTHDRVVLFDASPAHFGMRWAIQISEPKDRKQALVAEVVLKPESMFITRPPK